MRGTPKKQLEELLLKMVSKGLVRSEETTHKVVGSVEVDWQVFGVEFEDLIKAHGVKVWEQLNEWVEVKPNNKRIVLEKQKDMKNFQNTTMFENLGV